MKNKPILMFSGLIMAFLPLSACKAAGWTSGPIFPALQSHELPDNLKPGKPCAQVPDPARDIQTVSKYGERNDTNSTIIDPESEARYNRDMEPIADFAKEIARRSDHYIEGDSTALFDARCALDWLDTWAQADAFLGDINRQGTAVRKWELATFATTYIKISDVPFGERKKARVREWLRKVGNAVKDDYSTRTHWTSRQNNHLNWAAWSVAIAGIAAGDRELFDWGVDRYRFAVSQIRDDGALPLELARRSRAASYHMYALQPLIMLAEAGEVNGVAMYSYDNNRLQRLIDLNLAALDDLDVIGRLAMHEQEDLYSESVLSWMEPYYARFKDPRVLPWLKKHRPMSTRRTGGNMTALFNPSPKGK